MLINVRDPVCRTPGCKKTGSENSLLCKGHYQKCNNCARQGQIQRDGIQYCSQHVPCMVPGCEEPDHGRTVVCGTHYALCSLDECHEPATLGLGGTEPRCIRHIACTKDGCEGYGSYSTAEGASLSPFCGQHTCVIQNCSGQASRRITEGSRHWRLCIEHYNKQWRCLEPDCKRPRNQERVELPYCQEHIQCHLTSCRTNRRPGANFCGNHTCNYDSCPHASEDGQSYCVRHKCQGFLDKDKQRHCPMLRSSTSPPTAYCDLHTCQISVYYRRITCSNDNDNRTYCLDHRCVVKGCDMLRDIYPSSPQASWSSRCRMRKCKNQSQHDG